MTGLQDTRKTTARARQPAGLSDTQTPITHYVVRHVAVRPVGLIGALANRGVVFLEAAQRVKGFPWTRPDGPGGGVYAVSIFVHIGIATATTAALATATIVTNGLIAFGIGAAAPTVVKKIAGYAETFLPPNDNNDQPGRSEGHGT